MSRAGDIVLFRVKSRKLWKYPLSWLIRRLQGHDVSHVAIVVTPISGGAVVAEAWYPCARIALVREQVPKDYEWAIIRPFGCPPDQANKVAEYALGFVGTKYDTLGIFSLAWLFILEWTLGILIRDRIRPANREDRFFCSELVTFCYESAGFPMAEYLGFREAAAVTPVDLASATGQFDVIETSAGWGGW